MIPLENTRGHEEEEEEEEWEAHKETPANYVTWRGGGRVGMWVDWLI